MACSTWPGEQIEEGEQTLRGLIRQLRVRTGEPLPKPPSLEARLLGLVNGLQFTVYGPRRFSP
jgi:hypothetical protein